MPCGWQSLATATGLGTFEPEEGAAANPHLPAFL
jgi:hypothetical protein